MKIKMNVDIQNGTHNQAALEEIQTQVEEINRKVRALYDSLAKIRPLYVEIVEDENTPPAN